MVAIKQFLQTFKPARVRVYEPKAVRSRVNPFGECASNVASRRASGSAALAAGRYVTEAQQKARISRVMAAEI